ncbi:MAG: DivIVA domain-containing protein [Mycoplasmataceae bacterium]|jgi:DivIVA domain-containing protein|nr:DivIVA domain-containing protein [Mycoplasmataceae bacterium]
MSQHDKLTSKMEEILNKKFNRRIHSGYDPEDVDSFFDSIIAFLQDVNTVVGELDTHNQNLLIEIKQLKEQLNQKDQTIQTLSQEINTLKSEGYSNQRIGSQLRKMSEDLYKNNKK